MKIIAPLSDTKLSELLDYGEWEHYDPPISVEELYALVHELTLFRTLPKHAGSCSNQNVLNPIGAYLGVEECGCRKHK